VPDRTESFDVIVVGGGVIGLAAAWRLAERGARVVVLERVNARALTELPFAPQLVVCDVSFISVRTILERAVVYLAPQGEIVAAYRKLHLFDVDIPDGARYRESEAVAPGPGVTTTTELPGLGIRVGLSVCYDLRFPELYRKLSDMGADLLCVPAAFTAYTADSFSRWVAT